MTHARTHAATRREKKKSNKGLRSEVRTARVNSALLELSCIRSNSERRGKNNRYKN